MATVRLDVARRKTPRTAGHLAAWRAAAALPAIAGSFGVLLLFGWMGRWEGPALLAWLAPTTGLLTQAGERTAVYLDIVVALGRRQRLGPMAAVLAGGVVVAIIQSARAGHWAVAAVLGFVSAAPLRARGRPVRGVAGIGADLSSALRILGTNGPHQQRMASRLLSRHPVTARRIRALAGYSIEQRARHRSGGGLRDATIHQIAGQTENHGMHVSAPWAAGRYSRTSAENSLSDRPELKEE